MMDDADLNKGRYAELSNKEKRVETLIDEERYLELHTGTAERATYREEQLKQLNEEVGGHYRAVNFINFIIFINLTLLITKMKITKINKKFKLHKRTQKKTAEKDIEKVRTKKLGYLKYEEPDLEIKLSDELEGSLRRLKPEGHLLSDQFKRSTEKKHHRAKKVH